MSIPEDVCVVKGKRLDLVLEDMGLFASRQAARTAIMDGAVLVNGEKVTKPGQHIKDGSKIELTSQAQKPRYVSRGGFKLEKALEHFAFDPKGRICLDVGASTGGFTDCLLQHGADFVFAEPGFRCGFAHRIADHADFSDCFWRPAFGP